MEEERIGRVSKQQFDSLIQCEIQFDPVKRERAGGGGGGGSKETLHKAEQKEKRRGDNGAESSGDSKLGEREKIKVVASEREKLARYHREYHR